MADKPPPPTPPAGKSPSQRSLQEGNDLLRELQLVLAGLGKDQRRNSAEFNYTPLQLLFG